MDEIEVLYKVLNKAQSLWGETKNLSPDEKIISYFASYMQSFLNKEIDSEIAVRTNIIKEERGGFIFHVHTRPFGYFYWTETKYALR